MNVLVTGGSGFLGSRVVGLMRKTGADVYAPRQHEYDLRQDADLQELFACSAFDVVVHLAALVGGIGANRARPAEFFYDNAMMGIQLMHASWSAGVRKFVTTGTICSYPKYTPVPFPEDFIWNAYPDETNAPYGIAKRLLLTQSQAYRDQYGFNSIILLPTNLYGPGDHFELDTCHVIPAMIRKFVETRESNAPSVTLWGDGETTREFLYVDDAADAIMRAIDVYDSSEPINLGTGIETSIRDLAEMVRGAVGYRGAIEWDTSKPNGQPRRCLDVTRAKERLGWVATTPLAEGLRRTIEWYEAHR